jgi:hypothetical protein
MARSVLECANPLVLWGVAALGKDLRAAQAAACAAVECIQFESALSPRHRGEGVSFNFFSLNLLIRIQ